MNLRMVCRMVVWCSLCVTVFMLIVSNALLMSGPTAIVRYGGLFWVNPVACRVVAFEAVLCVHVWDIVCDVW